jgi:hypothetical protein
MKKPKKSKSNGYSEFSTEAAKQLPGVPVAVVARSDMPPDVAISIEFDGHTINLSDKEIEEGLAQLRSLSPEQQERLAASNRAINMEYLKSK